VVIDSTTDMITTRVKNPEHLAIDGLAVDEMHNKLYLLTAAATDAHVYVMDGALNTLGTPYVVPVTASAGAAPPIAVDPVTQRLFVLGVDANLKAVIVTLDGTTGQQKSLLNTTNSFSLYSSGVFALGNNNAAVSLLDPAIVKTLAPKDFPLPVAFTWDAVFAVPAPQATSLAFVGLQAPDDHPVLVLLDSIGGTSSVDLSSQLPIGLQAGFAIGAKKPIVDIDPFFSWFNPSDGAGKATSVITKLELRGFHYY
jgi:hypothetical protein